MRDFQRPGRSTAYGTSGMIATSHPLATLAGIECLKSGGSAADAAVTASAVLAVVEPQSTGIGGDCFALIKRPGEPLRGLNGSGAAPIALDAGRFLGKPAFDDTSVHSVTVPGAIAAWQSLLERYGRRSLGEALRPAIGFAETGFVVTPRVASDWRREEGRLRAHAGARMHLFKGGKAPAEGDVMRSPALAASLKLIAEQGPDAFYRGSLTDDMVATLRALGGAHTPEDFAAHRSDWVEPVTTPYRNFDIAEIPPNGHGITALILLGILRELGAPAADPDGAKRFHLLMESARLAYAVRDTYVADPRRAEVPVDFLLSAGLAKELAGRIDPKRRRDDLGPVPKPKGKDTIYLSVVDRDGLAISFINSIYFPFGSTITTEKTGIVLQNRGLGFSMQEGHPNAIAPGKRPLHTIIPGMALKGGEAEIVFGVMGGAFQPVGHATVMQNMLDYGLDPQSSLDAPRIFFEDGGLTAEKGVPEATKHELAAMGHTMKDADEPFGGGQIIRIDRERGVVIGGSDPRKDGFAAGY